MVLGTRELEERTILLVSRVRSSQKKHNSRSLDFARDDTLGDVTVRRVLLRRRTVGSAERLAQQNGWLSRTVGSAERLAQQPKKEGRLASAGAAANA